MQRPVDHSEVLATSRSRFRLLAAAVLGNVCEFFDFTSYAFFAVMIGKAFFPSDSPYASTLLSLAAFGVGFVARPFGSLLIGRYADRSGRRPALLLTILMMAGGTLMIAVTPGYETIGFAAPLLIVIARLLQGAALGGELGPATVYLFEVSSVTTRGIWTSWQPASQGLATMLAGATGALLATSLNEEELLQWGWRIPFVLGMVIVPIGLYLRRNLPETMPLPRREWRPSTHSAFGRRPGMKLQIAIFAQIGFGTISIYLTTYMTTFATQTLGLSPSVAFYSAIVAGLAVFASSLIGGWASDRFSRRIVIAAPRCLIVLVAIPMFSAVVSSQDILPLMLLSFALPFLAMISGGASFAAMIEALPVGYRSTGLATAYALVVTLLGGTAQFVVTWLIAATGDGCVPAYYLIAIGALSTATLPWLQNEGLASAEAAGILQSD
ncbi:MFS transporter [Sinorhizobium garamanticum]|uniref:MFS transporter n=1 Tax=Sinorhizobium garamanticum TaxID=680247 RepID=A0ABY8DIZ9_9HYPH|nr:MFS transporter [Sinorhizobium garamanticum]WEX90890.1 MFS transporter [Sinorhizobium garamanticum]